MNQGNCTMNEYLKALKKVAAMTNSAFLESHAELVFSSSYKYEAKIVLDGSSSRTWMTPVIRCESLNTACDPLTALAQMNDARNVILHAQEAILILRSTGVVRVYLQDCPCEICSGRGITNGVSCRHCEGGVRND